MSSRHLILVPFALLLSLLLIPTRTSAQTTTSGDVAGVVTDPSDAVVPDATVSLKDVAKGATQEIKTSKDGVYHFNLLAPGAYTVSVSATGFKVSTQQVSVSVGTVATVDVRLEIGATSQVIEVTGEAPLLQTESGNVTSTINESQAANIPNPGNDLTYMAQIAPGTVMNTSGGGYGNFSSFGMSALSNLFTINGMDDNDPFTNLNNSGATNLTLGQNEIQEVSVVTNGYSGEYGGLAGANINYITRSGTDRFHGRAAWYWNGRYLNANNWFNNATGTPRSFVNANQYGGDIGGPIKKDRMFFYFNAEGLYLVIPTSAQVLIPSPAFAAATQTNINTRFGANSQVGHFYQNMFALYAGAPGATRAKDTLNNHGCDGSEGLINSAAGTTFNSGPNPTPCALTYFSNVSNKTHENLQAGRFDWNVTNHDRFFARIQHDFGLQASVTDPINSVFDIQSADPEWQGQAQWVHTFNSGAANQFIVSGQFYSAVFTNASRSAALSTFPTSISWSFSNGSFTDMGGLDWLFPQGRRVSQFQLSDDYSKPIGVHTLKFGGKFRRNWISNTDYAIYSAGQLVPSSEDALFWGGTDPRPADSVKNTTSLTQAFPTALEQPFTTYSIGGYAEDDWRVKPSLLLTLAFRLDHPSNPVCTHDCFARSTVPFPNLNTDPTTPYNELIKINQKQMLYNLTNLEPQPRFGFAWQPHFWGIHDTVVRGGIGIFYDNFPGVLLDGISENPPLEPTFVLTNPSKLISFPSDPASLFTATAASNAAFQAGFTSGGSFNTISAAVPGFSPPSLAGTPNNTYAPTYQKWNLSVERSFGANTVVSIQYVGNHGYHIFFDNIGINGCNSTLTFASLPTCLTAAGSGINPSFLTVSYGQSIGVANYNGVTASFTHRYKSGQVQVNYTHSHTLDDVSNSGIVGAPFSTPAFGATNPSIVYPEDPVNPKKFNYGNADQDIRNMLSANYVWELPIKKYVTFGHGPDALVGGWDVNGAVFIRGGFPFTLIDGTDSSLLAPGGYGATVFGTQVLPGGTSQNCHSLFSTGPNPTPQPSSNICLAPNAFAASPDGFGNVTRNSIRGPSYWNSDFSLMKHTKLFKERAEFVFGAQFFNVFNHPNFDAPVMNVSSSRFGQVIRTVSTPTTIYGSGLGADASPRLIQLKTQFNF